MNVWRTHTIVMDMQVAVTIQVASRVSVILVLLEMALFVKVINVALQAYLSLNVFFDDMNLDFDECRNSTSNNCSQYADCNNLIGSFSCSCHGGFTGDGTYCDGKYLQEDLSLNRVKWPDQRGGVASFQGWPYFRGGLISGVASFQR